MFVNTASSSGAFLQALAGPGRTIVTGHQDRRRAQRDALPRVSSSRRSQGDAADRDRNGRVSVLEAFDYAKTKVTATYEQGGNILTEHATLDDGSEGKLAATCSWRRRASRSADDGQSADPALRALVEQRDALERQVCRAEAAERLDGRRDATSRSSRSC